jgi:hypothetical protein
VGQSIQEAVLKVVQEKYNKLTWKAEQILIENTEKDIAHHTDTFSPKKSSWIIGKLTGETSQISTKSLSNTSDTHTETFGVPVPRVLTTQTVRVCSMFFVFLCFCLIVQGLAREELFSLVPLDVSVSCWSEAHYLMSTAYPHTTKAPLMRTNTSLYNYKQHQYKLQAISKH